MRGVNRVILIGVVSSEPEVRYSKDGTAVASLSLATSESWADAGGQRRERTERHRVVAFAKVAEIAKELAKGALVYVEGSVRTRAFEQDGAKRAVEVIARELQLIGAGEGETKPRAESRASSFDPRGEVYGARPRKRYSTEPESTEPFVATDADVPF